jgi:hypothetical protein
VLQRARGSIEAQNRKRRSRRTRWGAHLAVEDGWRNPESEGQRGGLASSPARCGPAALGSAQGSAEQGQAEKRERRPQLYRAQARGLACAARTPRRWRPGRPWRLRTLWPVGPQWAPRGPRPGQLREEGGWVGPSGSTQLDRIYYFFSETIFQCISNARKSPKNTLKHEK